MSDSSDNDIQYLGQGTRSPKPSTSKAFLIEADNEQVCFDLQNSSVYCTLLRLDIFVWISIVMYFAKFFDT